MKYRWLGAGADGEEVWNSRMYKAPELAKILRVLAIVVNALVRL